MGLKHYGARFLDAVTAGPMLATLAIIGAGLLALHMGGPEGLKAFSATLVTLGGGVGLHASVKHYAKRPGGAREEQP